MVRREVKDFLKKIADDGYLVDMGVQGAREYFLKAQGPYKQINGVIMNKGEVAGIETYRFSLEKEDTDSRIFLFIHGGGGTIGSVLSHSRLIQDLVLSSGITCYGIEYSLTPESKFPTQIDQVFNVAVEFIEKGYKVSIVGNSFGGGVACSTTNKLIKSGYEIESCVMMWPMVDAFGDSEYDSYALYAEGFYLTEVDMEWFWNNYKANNLDFNNIECSPVHGYKGIGSFKNFPKSLIITNECDVLRDEGEKLYSLMCKDNVPVTNTRYNGVIHDFGMLNALKDLPETKMMVEQIGTFLKN